MGLHSVAPTGSGPEDTTTGQTCTTDANGTCSFGSDLSAGNYYGIDTSPENLIGPRAASASCTASAIALICRGLVPEQIRK